MIFKRKLKNLLVITNQIIEIPKYKLNSLKVGEKIILSIVSRVVSRIYTNN